MKRLLALALLAACSSTGRDAEPAVVADVAVEEAGAAWDCQARVELSSLWKALSERYDPDGDGRILREDYPRGELRFANFDRTGDGVLTRDDFPSDGHFNGFSNALVGRADGNGDGRVTFLEWDEYCAAWDGDGDGTVAPDELRPFLEGWADDWRLFLLSFDQDADGDFDLTDIELTFVDQDFDGDGVLTGKELEGWASPMDRDGSSGPAPGDPAPPFALGHAGDPERTFDLEEELREKPVALLFGSYT